jgi:hypothetical protein
MIGKSAGSIFISGLFLAEKTIFKFFGSLPNLYKTEAVFRMKSLEVKSVLGM